jgi:hypothetical protein
MNAFDTVAVSEDREILFDSATAEIQNDRADLYKNDQFRVVCQGPIRGHEPQGFGNRLGDEYPVKRIAMEIGKFPHGIGMLPGDRQWEKARLNQTIRQTTLIDLELSQS